MKKEIIERITITVSSENINDLHLKIMLEGWNIFFSGPPVNHKQSDIQNRIILDGTKRKYILERVLKKTYPKPWGGINGKF